MTYSGSGKPAPKKQNQSPRVLPSERARIESGNTLTRLFHGAPETKSPLSYYTPLLIQCTLPHSDPKAEHWKKTNGDFTLIISSGVDKDLKPYGIPYGSFPRLMLAHIITSVIQTGERRLKLSSSFGKFLKEVGYTGDIRSRSRQGKTIKAQMDKLLSASITWEGHEGTAERGQYVKGRADVASKFGLWWDYKSPDQESLFGSWIELTEDFHSSIVNNPVPLRTDVLAALRKSPLALDVYMWASYRLHNMQQRGQDQISLSYGQLQNQFGSGIAEAHYRKFRQELKLAFAKVAAHWHAPSSKLSQLHYEFGEKELMLYRSPLLVGKAKLKGKAAEAERILRDKAFDMETRKQARLIAGSKWDMRWLEEQYFKWIEQESITPKNPRAHFFNFVKTHRKRNGESA